MCAVCNVRACALAFAFTGARVRTCAHLCVCVCADTHGDVLNGCPTCYYSWQDCSASSPLSLLPSPQHQGDCVATAPWQPLQQL